MISLNLLPDIKKEYLKTQRLKRLFIMGSFIISAGFVALAILLAIFVFGVQRLQLSAVQSDIDTSLNQLQSVEDLDKIVTIQKQLGSLPELHDEKPAVDRLFSYLSKLVPNNVRLTEIELRFADELSGEFYGIAATPKAINVFVDTIKNAELTYEGAESPIKPFTSVVLEDPIVEDDEVSYQINIRFDEALFDNTLTDVKLSVPNITTTGSITERPVLFDGESEEDSSED